MSEELKPCPFCGGDAKIVEDDLVWVECTECWAKSGTDSMAGKEMVIYDWNTRHAPDPSGVVEALEFLLEPYRDYDDEYIKGHFNGAGKIIKARAELKAYKMHIGERM